MGLAMDGLVSGLDTSSIISSLVAAAGANLNQMRSQQAEIELRRSHWQTMQTHLGDLKSAIDAVNESAELKAMQATSEDTSLVTAEITGSALAGTYSVDVTQLASSQITSSDSSWADGSDTFSAGGSPEISITIDGDTTDITLTTNTLDGAIAAINDANIGIMAYKVEQQDGTFVMMLASEETGDDYAFNITTSDGQSFTDQQDALDTLATVNGVDVRSSTTTLSDVVPGITLSALGITGGAVDVVVNVDYSGIKDNIQSFVDAYNTVLSYVNFEVSVNDVSGDAGPLAGDNTLRQIQRTLQDLVRDTYTTNDIDSLAKLGISTEKSGALTLDSSELTDVLNSSFSQVISFFTDTGGFFEAFVDEAESGALDFILDSTDGTVQTKLDSLDEQVTDLEEQIEKEETRLEKVEQSLRDRFTALEVTLSKLKLSEAYVTNVLAKQTSNKD